MTKIFELLGLVIGFIALSLSVIGFIGIVAFGDFSDIGGFAIGIQLILLVLSFATSWFASIVAKDILYIFNV